ncbi:MAG TPA: FAD:protein FMN transferase [Candidatus Marinimicrobia bacterium]|nr:FAD:protein FMN transferase [Candidatus Neomarinimicrobiota bacterium]HIB70836.1 FAD:protein FMN transferase [Candidatus Neomarinimicrobiota bacterium]
MFRSLTLAATISLIFTACGGPSSLTVLEGITMGTTYQLKYVSPNGLTVPAVLKVGIDSVLIEVNRQMSTYIPGSEISWFNRSESTEPITVGEEFYYVVNRALYWSRKSNGAFDITVFPLLYLWGFGPGDTGVPDQFPDSSTINRRMSHVGYEKIRTEKSSIVKLDPYISIDLNAIAKGFGVDAVFDYLESQNVSDMMVEIGGEVRVKGKNLQAKQWAIAIERPKLSAEREEGFDWVINLDNQAMATSGDYRNYFEIDGEIYSHEIDPRTGYPSQSGIASATVTAPTCTDADALATALMVMSITDGLELVESLPEVEAFLIIRETADRFRSQQSSGMNVKPY